MSPVPRARRFRRFGLLAFVLASQATAQSLTLGEAQRIAWGGAFENQQRALARRAVIVPITIGLIFVLLYTVFNSFIYAALILANVPFAIIGGVFALALTGQYVSAPSAIGFIAVFGVAMLNGIVLVSFINVQRLNICSSSCSPIRQ